jgi:hypothetical protein
MISGFDGGQCNGFLNLGVDRGVTVTTETSMGFRDYVSIPGSGMIPSEPSTGLIESRTWERCADRGRGLHTSGAGQRQANEGSKRNQMVAYPLYIHTGPRTKGEGTTTVWIYSTQGT